MHGAAEGISIQQEIRDFRIGWYLESNSVWNLKSEQDKAAKRKESFRTLRAGSWWNVSKVAWREGRRMLNKCGKRTRVSVKSCSKREVTANSAFFKSKITME